MPGVFVEQRRKIPVIEQADVVVVGGGTAGLPAAVAAARSGAKTVLVERWGYTGGAAVGGLVITVPKNAGIWGIQQEFYDELKKLGGVRFLKKEQWYNVSAPYCKYLGDQYLKRAGVVILYHSWFADVIRNGNRIEAVIIENKSGRQAVQAKVVVDCTGDADVAFRLGMPTEKGDANGKMDPVTAMYMMANIKTKGYDGFRRLRRKRPRLKVSWFAITEVNPGEANCWGGNAWGDGTDVRDITRMEIDLREQVITESRNMQKYLPGFKDAFVSIMAEQMGVRETRRIVADYTLTGNDVKEKRAFDDSIGAAYEFTIPYRSLLPKGSNNLLVAGRCIGADRRAHGRVRIVPNCCTTGQAAGTAAALAVDSGVPPRRIDIGRLQARLDKQGINLGVRSPTSPGARK
jgi:ribulose 1,5-bisphosphate synthetase/thiazole synthase